ncbi:MAG TPA: hypothetical protein VET23_13565, partial [Chitinophagaceae bacterium]|nr:hypothetical protein [Chitinophagaceae bacterium]
QKENIDFTGARIEQLDINHDFLVLPIKDEIINNKNLGSHSTLTLLLITDKFGKISSGSIVYFQPSDGEKHESLPENTFSNLFSGKTVAISGTYKILTVTGRWISQFETKNGKLFSTGKIQQKDKSNKDTQASKTTGCIDWYLVTTFHWADGSTTQTSEYIRTTCDGCDDPNEMSLCPDGGGGDGSIGTVEGEETVTTSRSEIYPGGSDGLDNTNQHTIGVIYTTKVDFTYDYDSHTFVDITPFPPTATPPSQFFWDDNGNLATLTVTCTPWSFESVPLTTKSFYAIWSFIANWLFVYSTGALPPLLLMKVRAEFALSHKQNKF